MKFAHVRASGHFTFAEQIFHRKAISLARKGKFRCVPALWQVRRGGSAIEQYKNQNTYQQEKDEELQKFLVLFSWQALHLKTQMHVVKCFASAKREIICYRTLWNISPCSMWNEICPRPRKRTFHICGANISPQSDFTCPKGQISLRTCSMAGTQSVGNTFCPFLSKTPDFDPENHSSKYL